MLHEVRKERHVLVKERCHAAHLTRVVVHEETVVTCVSVNVHTDGIHNHRLAEQLFPTMSGGKGQNVINVKSALKHTSGRNKSKFLGSKERTVRR